MARRWGKLERDFYLTKSNRFEISKIPDIYDCIKYDLQHNQEVLQFDDAEELYACSKAMADIIIPQVKNGSYVYIYIGSWQIKFGDHIGKHMILKQ